MRGHVPRRRLLALLVVLAVVVTTALVLERSRPSAPTDTALLGIRADDIVAIRVREGTRELRAARPGAVWCIEAPLAARPDAPAAVAEMVDVLAALVAVDTFERGETGRRDFGLEPARARIEIDVRGRAEQVVLLLGDYVPTGGSVYGALASERSIHQIGAGIVSEIEKAFYLTLPDEEGEGASGR